MLQLEFSQIDYIPPVQSVCSEGSLVSLVSYYPPAGRRGPVCTRNARQAVLSKTLNAKSLHQCVKARNSSEWQGLWGTTHSSHLCCRCWEKPLQGKGKGPGEQKSWSSNGRTPQALWGVVENCLPSPGSLQPFVIHTHAQPNPFLEVCQQRCFLKDSKLSNKILVPYQIRKSSMILKHLCPGATWCLL